MIGDVLGRWSREGKSFRNLSQVAASSGREANSPRNFYFFKTVNLPRSKIPNQNASLVT